MLLDGLNVRGFGLGLYRVLGSQKVVSFMGGGGSAGFRDQPGFSGVLEASEGLWRLWFRV